MSHLMDSKPPVTGEPQRKGVEGKQSEERENYSQFPTQGLLRGSWLKTGLLRGTKDLGWGQGTTCLAAASSGTGDGEPVKENEFYVVCEKESQGVCV